MYLLFGHTDVDNKLYIGVLTGDQAALTAQWFINAADIPASITFTDVPTMVFSGSPPQNFQICDWIKSKVFLDRLTTPGWTWSSSKTLMPPQPPVTTRHFEMAVSQGRYFRCTGFTTHDGPTLVPYAGNTTEDNTNGQITLFDVHAVQISTPMGFNILIGNKRKAPREA